jgi:DNA-binding NarL/FixJ family response regulator
MRLHPAKTKAQTAREMSARAATARIRVAIVEDDDELRQNLAEFLWRGADLEVAGAFGDAETALEKLPSLKPAVVLMDINLPGLDGIQCVQRLKQTLPETQFMMLTVYEDNDRLFRSLASGASGYLLKRASPAEIVNAVRDLHAGGSPMTPQIARRVVQHYQQAVADATPAEGLGELSSHQLAFLEQLAKGYRYKEIADNLGISMEGVRSYVRRIYEKLHVHSRTEAVVKFLGR